MNVNYIYSKNEKAERTIAHFIHGGLLSGFKTNRKDETPPIDVMDASF